MAVTEYDLPTYSVSCDATAPERQVAEQVNRLESLVGALADQRGRIEQRLEPVLLADQGAKDGACAPREVLVPLADRLRNIAETLEGVHRRYNEVEGRLEL